MTQNSEVLKSQLLELQTLAVLQRGLRLGLRAFWLGLAGGILAWGVNSLWGWLPDRRSWALLALAFASLPLVGLFTSFLPLISGRRTRWVWSFDRRLGFQEQVSTAFEVAHQHAGAPGETMSDALVADVLTSLPGIRERMLRRGWFLERDLVATLLVVLLALMAYSSTWVRSYADLIGQAQADISQPSGMLPPSAALPPPSANAQLEQGASGEGEQPGAQEGAPSGDPSSGEEGQGTGEGTEADPEALNDALRELGKDLSEQAPTYDLGQSLQQDDLEGAASALEDLAERADELSPETRQNLSEALDKAAGQVEAAGDSALAEDLRDAADALGQNPESGETGAGEALDQLAEDLRSRSAAGAGAGAGDGSGGQTGSAESTERLQGEGGNMEIPLTDETGSGLLNQAPPGSDGSGTAAGSQDSSTSSSGSYGSPLVPNNFLWKWRDIISSYFKR